MVTGDVFSGFDLLSNIGPILSIISPISRWHFIDDLLSIFFSVGCLCLSESCHSEHASRGESESSQRKCDRIVQVC